MTLQQTVELLHHLRLKAMADGLDAQRMNATMQTLSFEERLGLLVDAENQARESRRIARLLRNAHLKTSAYAEDVDYRVPRGLDRQLFSSLLSCDWVEQFLNLIITGPTGVGKTWLACALGHQAARKGYSVLYKRLSRLLEELQIGHGDGSTFKLRSQLAAVDLLVIDDWGLTPLTARSRHDLMELIDDRSGSGALLLTSQLPVENWHDYIGDPTIADAILDRIVHNAHRIPLRGESLRKQAAAVLKNTS